MIRLVSLAFSQEFARLIGHEGPISDLVSHPVNDKIVASCSKDGTLRLWDINTKACVINVACQPTVAAFDLSGTTVLVGNSSGEVIKFNLPPTGRLEGLNQTITNLECTAAFPSKHHGGRIDCLQLVQTRVVSKSGNGRIFSWDLESGEILSKFNVRNSTQVDSRFGISPDGEYVCVGSALGSVYIHQLSDGKLLAELRNRRSTHPILACTFARCGRNIVCSNKDGYLFRYDYISPSTLEEWRKWAESEV